MTHERTAKKSCDVGVVAECFHGAQSVIYGRERG